MHGSENQFGAAANIGSTKGDDAAPVPMAPGWKKPGAPTAAAFEVRATCAKLARAKGPPGSLQRRMLL